MHFFEVLLYKPVPHSVLFRIHYLLLSFRPFFYFLVLLALICYLVLWWFLIIIFNVSYENVYGVIYYFWILFLFLTWWGAGLIRAFDLLLGHVVLRALGVLGHVGLSGYHDRVLFKSIVLLFLFEFLGNVDELILVILKYVGLFFFCFLTSFVIFFAWYNAGVCLLATNLDWKTGLSISLLGG